jgi:hypothetical protein
MFKWVSWVVKLGATALLLSFLCIWTTGYIVNSYMETVIKQLELPIETQPFALSGVWGKLWGAQESPEAALVDKPVSKAEDAQTDTDSDSDSDSDNDTLQSSEANKQNESVEQNQDNQKESSNGSGEQNGEPSPSPEPNKDVGAIAAENIEDAENNEDTDTIPVLGDQIKLPQLTDEERQELYAMVVSKLNAEQMKQLSESLQDGLTAEELVKLQSMLKSALSESEYSQMMALLNGKQQAADEDLETGVE